MMQYPFQGFGIHGIHQKTLRVQLTCIDLSVPRICPTTTKYYWIRAVLWYTADNSGDSFFLNRHRNPRDVS
jgi:hypothetical protein